MITGLLRNFDAKDFIPTRYSNQSIKMIRAMPRIKSPFFIIVNRIALLVLLKSARFLIMRKESCSEFVPRKNAVEHNRRKVAVILSPFSMRGTLVNPLIRSKFDIRGLKILARMINNPCNKPKMIKLQ